MGLLIVGSIALDNVETSFDKVVDSLGGSATFISISASYFTNPINLVGVVGDDFDNQHIDLLKRRKIDLTGLQIKSGKTFRWGGKYHNDFNNRDTLFTELGVFETFNPILPEEYKADEIVVLGNILPSLQLNVLQQLTNPKFIICDTMNLWISIAKEDLIEVIKKVDLLIINDSEAKELSGINNTIKAAKKVMELGCKYLIIKKGEHGALLFSKDDFFSAPALPIEDIFDPTGAGDTFAGGLAGYLHKTNDFSFENLKKAVIYGTTMASFCVESFSIKKIEELNDEKINERYTYLKLITGF